MEHIGYSLVDDAGKEVKCWGDKSGECAGIPDCVTWPSGDQTYCAAIGAENSGARLVERWLDPSTGTEASESITFDGSKVIVTRVVIAPRVLVHKSVIVDRLHDAGKLESAKAALNSADLYTQERWNSRDAIYADDPTALALLKAIGADPSVILGAE